MNTAVLNELLGIGELPLLMLGFFTIFYYGFNGLSLRIKTQVLIYLKKIMGLLLGIQTKKTKKTKVTKSFK